MPPGTAGILRYIAYQHLLRRFAYQHLPEHLQAVSKPFSDLAHGLAHDSAHGLEGPELTVGLRKLLEAKDCIVRSAIAAKPQET